MSTSESTDVDPVKMLTEACQAAGSQKAWAAQNEVSQQYVSNVLTGQREPGETICRALGIERVVIYRASQEVQTDER